MEPAMADAPITERQKFWRDHVLAAATFDGTIVEYAKSNNLKTKDIYQWKTSLARRGLLDDGTTEKTMATDFVLVPSGSAKSAKTQESIKLRLTLSCGAQLEIFSAENYSLSRS